MGALVRGWRRCLVEAPVDLGQVARLNGRPDPKDRGERLGHRIGQVIDDRTRKLQSAGSRCSQHFEQPHASIAFRDRVVRSDRASPAASTRTGPSRSDRYYGIRKPGLEASRPHYVNAHVVW
jgi:hypothetical protein